MAAEENQPDWASLPAHLLKSIGKRTRDAVTGVVKFRSVCRAWRAAVGPAPFLMRPRADAIVMPLPHGWCIVVDARDASCFLSHLATGTTAALPMLNAVRHAGSDVVTHLPYVHSPDSDTLIDNTLMVCTNYLMFTDFFRFAVHVPPGAPPATAAGMTIMMYHVMLGPWGTGMSFCRPGDVAWTSVYKPFPVGHGYFDFAYHDGKMFGLNMCGEMEVFDAATLRALCIVQRPPATPNIASKMHGQSTIPAAPNIPNKMYSKRANLEEFNFVHLVALPSKLVLVRTSIKSSRPVAFDVFELRSTPDGGLAWLKVRDAGNYELFLDGYHTTFRENDGANSGTRIYYVHDTSYLIRQDPRLPPSAYSYSMQDNILECVYMPPEDIDQCLTKPSWFVP